MIELVITKFFIIKFVITEYFPQCVLIENIIFEESIIEVIECEVLQFPEPNKLRTTHAEDTTSDIMQQISIKIILLRITVYTCV
jgi:hypothetical protein